MFSWNLAAHVPALPAVEKLEEQQGLKQLNPLPLLCPEDLLP
jgi:hypothetical protein